jgi:hypothetical protein
MLSQVFKASLRCQEAFEAVKPSLRARLRYQLASASKHRGHQVSLVCIVCQAPLGILEHYNAAGRTALMLAANASNIPMVRQLLRRGVDPHQTCFGTNPGRTARDFAWAAGGNKVVMGLLQAAEADRAPQ